ncbi:MAG: glycosyltransferase family 4 protein [Candidatus Pacebacteria bacterium]|nr:glycosyltransferase family 4 protein [Candidatus Paceibacterota bacterium]
MKPKITIFHCSFIYTGGGERIVFGQVEELLKRGFEVEVFAPVIDEKKCYPDIIKKYSIKTLLPQLPGWFPFRHAILMLLTSALMPVLALRFKKTDLFIGENQPGVWLAYLCSKVLGKPYLIYTCHPNKMIFPRNLSREQIWKNQPDFYFLSILFIPFKKVVAFLDRISFRGSGRRILTNGFFIGRETAKTYGVDWLGCPSGAPFVKTVKNNNSLKGKIRVGDLEIKKPYLLYVGRHEVWKRIDLAIKAFKKITAKHPDLRFVIRGQFTCHTDDLKKLVEKSGLKDRVLFSRGGTNQNELRRLYFNGLLYVFPSKKEDFGIVIIEAMGAGLPVVAWNRGGPRDIVIDGQTGYLAKPYSVDDFAEKILKLLESPSLRKKMSQAGARRIKKEFTWQKHGDILEKEIREILSEPQKITF